MTQLPKKASAQKQTRLPQIIKASVIAKAMQIHTRRCLGILESEELTFRLPGEREWSVDTTQLANRLPRVHEIIFSAHKRGELFTKSTRGNRPRNW